MAIPKYHEFMKPLLFLLHDRADHKIQSINTSLADQFKLTEEERSELIPSGKQPIYKNRIGWAKTYLNKAGLLTSTRRGSICITELGIQIVKENPPVIDSKYLMRFPAFIRFTGIPNMTTEPSHTPGPAEETILEDKTPLELIGNSVFRITQALKTELMTEIMKSSSAFFEQLVVDLVVAMGYGGTAEDAARVVGKSGDEGVDGIIKADRLGFDRIYIQAKRWDPETTIGRPEIQKFLGALVGQGAIKGIYITTAGFSKDAMEFANKNISQRIILIDGNLLTQLMIEHNIAVSIQDTILIRRIDLDYFENGK